MFILGQRHETECSFACFIIHFKILTDGWQAYKSLPNEGFTWDSVNHQENFVNPDDRTVHTNRIEGESNIIIY